MADAPQPQPHETAITTERLIGELRSVLVDMGLQIDGEGRDMVLKSAIAKLRELTKGNSDSGSGSASPASDTKVANALRTRLGLSESASEAETLLALSLSDTAKTDRNTVNELAALKRSECDRLAKDRVDKYVSKNVINPNDKDQYAAAMSLSRENPERFEALMQRGAAWVSPGETQDPAGGTIGRQRIIATARTEFASSDLTKSITTIENFVNDALREKSFPVLTSDEITTLV